MRSAGKRSPRAGCAGHAVYVNGMGDQLIFSQRQQCQLDRGRKTTWICDGTRLLDLVTVQLRKAVNELAALKLRIFFQTGNHY